MIRSHIQTYRERYGGRKKEGKRTNGKERRRDGEGEGEGEYMCKNKNITGIRTRNNKRNVQKSSPIT